MKKVFTPQVKIGTTRSDSHNLLQRKAVGDSPLLDVPPIVNEALRSPGQSLDPGTRMTMESRFGHDFSQVRVHKDGLAAESAQAVNAHAYTVGSHIVFNTGTFDPASQAGKKLLAHELTHTIQQQTGLDGSAESPASEQEAEHNANRIVQATDPVSVQNATGPGVARQPATPDIAEVVIPKDDPNSYLVYADPTIKGANKDRRLLLPAGTKMEARKKTGEWREVRLVDGPDPGRTGMLKEKFVHLLPAAPKALAPGPKAPAPQHQPAAGGVVDPLKRPAQEIMADDKYMDNNITRMEFYSAQEAHIFYKDGSKLELGLVPPYVKDPIDGVDYRTPRTTHISVESNEPGVYKYIPRGTEVKPQGNMKFADVLDQLTRDVTFKIETNSNRIVPTQVNTRTAPIVCQMLMTSENEYEKLMDATSKGGVKIFESFKRVLEIYSFLPAGGIAKAATSGTKAAVGAASTASEGMIATLVKKLAEVLAKGGVAKELVVEGVALGEVVVSRKGTALAVEYTFIQNVGRVAGQGRMMQVALEKAAIQVAKDAGAKEAQVIVHTVVNTKWLAYLESLGYTKTILEKAGGAGFEGVWMKVIQVGS
jgi:hypothetical protein